MEKITVEALQGYLDEIIACEAFEFHKAVDRDGTQTFYIPYMMNDALECYLMLTDGNMTGEYRPEQKEELSAVITETDKGPAVIFRQGSANVFTVWFQSCYRVLECYRYDQIGHFWIEGAEQWRRLVYIIGTIYDKFNYMGEAVCNEQEMELMPLMEFAPFRYFSPIHDSLDDYYEESAAGLETMKKLAIEAEDRSFLKLLKLYEAMPLKRSCVRWLVRAMKNEARNDLYQLIFSKVQEAAEQYPERTYLETIAKEIADARETCVKTMEAYGFSGEYPLFRKDRLQILAMEEHPFTILESDQYQFKIQYMVSEKDESSNASNRFWRQSGGTMKLNAGFFSGKGNHGWIARDLEFLKQG